MEKISESILELHGSEIDYDESDSLRIHEKSESSALTISPSQQKNNNIILGVLIGFTDSGVPLVDFPDNKLGEAVLARSTLVLSISQIGSEIALAFERGDLTKPIILGCLLPQMSIEREGRLNIRLDGEQLTFSAEREIVLSCGKASITLTRAGKVLISGAYLLSRSSGVNRIKGGSVQIN